MSAVGNEDQIFSVWRPGWADLMIEFAVVETRQVVARLSGQSSHTCQIPASEIANKVAGKFPPQSWGFESGEHLLFGSSGRVLVVTSSLWRLIQFAWCSVPIDHVRICANPECKAPYFVAKDLRQRFCSEICAQWGQREWKRQWWAAKGGEWRKSRPKATKHSKKKGAAADGTRKAR